MLKKSRLPTQPLLPGGEGEVAGFSVVEQLLPERFLSI